MKVNPEKSIAHEIRHLRFN